MLRSSVSYGLHHKNTDKSTRIFNEKSRQLVTNYAPSMIGRYGSYEGNDPIGRSRYYLRIVPRRS